MRTFVSGTRLVAVLLVVWSFPALASFFPEEVEVPQDTREFFVDETKLPFDELPGLPSTRYWGIDEGAGFRMEVPDNWNGDLVVYAHGFRGDGAELTVDSPPIRQYYLATGYAWLASSYSKNFYDVRAGVESTNSLVRHFKATVGEPNRVYITGFSMGGHVTSASIEMFPNRDCGSGWGSRWCQRIVDLLGELSGGVRYDGAAPFCGVMADYELFEYFGDFSNGAETLAGVTSQFPPPPDYFDTIFVPTISALYLNPFDLLGPNPETAVPNALGEKLRTYTTQISGGPRPLADFAFAFYQQLLFSFSGTDGTLDGVISGNIYDNTTREYQLDADPAVSAEEVAFNNDIIRVARDPGVNPLQFLRVSRIPRIFGRIDVPVLSVHTTGDLFVPFKMQQVYREDTIARNRSHNLVQRATRAIGHCEFSGEELIETFDDLVSWVEDGTVPGGDDVLDPATLADPLYGCNYSRGTTATRPLAPCP